MDGKSVEASTDSRNQLESKVRAKLTIQLLLVVFLDGQVSVVYIVVDDLGDSSLNELGPLDWSNIAEKLLRNGKAGIESIFFCQKTTARTEGSLRAGLLGLTKIASWVTLGWRLETTTPYPSGLLCAFF